MKRKILLTLSTFFIFLEVFFAEGIPALKETFTLENPEAVLFTLSQNVNGAQDFAIALFLGILKTSILHSLCLLLLLSLILLLIAKLNKKSKILSKIASPLKIFVCTNILLFANILFIIATQIPVFDYYFAWKDATSIPKHSEFYQREYVHPDSAKISFNKKNNLILIFLESMEYNYQDSANGGNLSVNAIPEISDYIKNEQSFIPGGAPVWGMGWTMADVVAKTCGIPLALPPRISESFKPLESFLPGVKCLTDILIENDYNFVVSKGANLHFSGMSDFLNTHSNPRAFGLLEYAKDERFKKDTVEFWGVKDALHYEMVKEHIDTLTKQEKPWAIWMFTTDTHTPYGYLDPQCASGTKIPAEKQFPEVLKCSAKTLHKFIQWAQTQDWFTNTTIAVMGDHASMAAPEVAGFTDKNLTHYWLDFFINPAIPGKGDKRYFSSLDFFPTILESIGAEIPDGALGLGRSLYSKKQTLLEKYGKDSLDNALKKTSLEYNHFLYGVR